MLVVIAYDTPSNRRRRKMARIADDFGCRIQKSIFQGWLNRDMRHNLIKKLEQIVDKKEDSIFIIPVCARCRQQLVALGTVQIEALPPYWIV